ncbi:hypothetical protein GCM10009836_70280 [Pseudonocardia ailaonensis]|uniref:Uncharacterized protein n=1 Tax=Pseudonocardia ailaonensis TaxID=367279 RepID=A0ABN2NNY8_9PSEU
MTIDMTTAQAADARATAIGDLLDALESLTATYSGLPDHERAGRCSADADRITAEVARHLFAARSRLTTRLGRR